MSRVLANFMNLKTIDYRDWTSQWAGKWSILTFSYWGNFYCRKPFSKDINRYVDQTVIFSKEGKGWAYQRASIKKKFATKLGNKTIKDSDFVEKLCANLKNGADKVSNYMKNNIGKDVDFLEYKNFQDSLVNDYYPYHIENKLVADVMSPELLKKYLPLLEEARVHAEPVFNMVEEYMQALAKIHANKTNYSPNLILSTVKNEFDLYFSEGQSLPEKFILEKRYKESVYIFDEKNVEIVVEKRVKCIENIIRRSKLSNELSGATAFPGKVTGKVKLVLDVEKVKETFVEGDILVTGMTRPEYLPLMKKAAAFVTDSGGILSHAAITARELRKPCIIGTEIATKVLKDGDYVEINATNGIIKIIKRAD